MIKARSPLGLFGFVFVICLAALATTWVGRWTAWTGPALIGALASLALYFMGHSTLKSYAFTVWVFVFVAASIVYPWLFLKWRISAEHPFDLKYLINPLIQIITFGMGTTLSLADFGRVLRMPWPIGVGFIAQFLIMPLTGFLLASVFGFESGVAAGIILIGSCPSGVASNVMSYLGGGNVALSVTITSCTTLAAPFMTPLLMGRLAGQFIEVNFFGMMMDIINIIIVPIAAGLVAHRILYGRGQRWAKGRALAITGAVCALGAFAIIQWAPRTLFSLRGGNFQKDGIIVGLLLIGTVTFAKLIVGVWLKRPDNWMDKALPVVSMFSICCIIAVITAHSVADPKTAAEFRKVGALLIVVTMIHNAVGYCLGYWLARLTRLEESWCRTVAFEVGMQNGGLASSLAMNTLNNLQAALAPAIFGPWQNISGSILATWWRRKPVRSAVMLQPVNATMDKRGTNSVAAD